MTTQAPPRLPRYQGHDPEVRLAWDQLCYALETWMQAITAPGNRYLVTNTTDARSFDGLTATGTDAANTLGTLIHDLQRKGVLG